MCQTLKLTNDMIFVLTLNLIPEKHFKVAAEQVYHRVASPRLLTIPRVRVCELGTLLYFSKTLFPIIT